MLRRSYGVSAEDQLGQLARSADESNLAMAGFTGEDLEASWQQLEHLFGWSLEANRFGRSRFVEVTITVRLGCIDDARPENWRRIGDKRCFAHRHFGFEGLGLPRRSRVCRNDQRKMTRRGTLLRSPLCDQNDRRNDDREQKGSNDDCDND